MSEVPTSPNPETGKPEFTIRKVDGAIEVSTPHVDLASEREPLRFAVTIAKVPTKIEDGVRLEGTTVDRESPKLQEMIRQAAELKDIPDRDKPRKIMEILRTNVHFAYNDVVDELAKTNQDLAKWVSENTGVNSSSARELTLSQVVDSGYGVCRHLSVGMLVLAKEAGMEGALLTNGPGARGDLGPVRNVVRKDNGQPLFKMGSVGDPIGGHAWVELKTSEGEWIPVDPSTQLVGDTPEGMDTFREANYRAAVGFSLEVSGYPPNVRHTGVRNLEPLPGEAIHTGVLEVNSQPREKPIKISFGANGELQDEVKDNEVWPKPTSYQGPLTFQMSSVPVTSGLSIAVIDAKLA